MRRGAGFTLVELLIAMAIVAILIGILVPRLNIGLKAQKLDASVRELASCIGLAQQYAMGQKDSHRFYGIVFFINGGLYGYRIVYGDAGLGPFTPITVPSSINENGDIMMEEGVTISDTASIIFDYRGSLIQPADIQRVLSLGTINMTITVRQLTGAVEVSK